MESIFIEIENLCKDKFDSLWIKEVDRITTIWRRFLLFADTRSKTSSDSKYRNNDYDFRCDDFARKILFVEREKPLSKSQRGHLRDFAYMLAAIEKKGIEKYLKERKMIWYKNLTFKLNKYLNELLLPSDRFISGEVDTSTKGYTMRVKLIRHHKDPKIFETLCFPAGGNNIQCFHYRYKGSIK